MSPSLMVPNGCGDGSDEICRALSRQLSGIRVVECLETGWGAAVRAGLAASRGDSVCYTNLARTSSDDLSRVLDTAARFPHDAVKARRDVRESITRRWGSRLYNMEARALFRVGSSDVNGTPKVFPRRFAPLLSLTRNDDLIDLEFMIECRRRGYRVREVGIQSTQRHGGRSTTRWKSAVRMYSGALALWRSRAAIHE